MASMVGYVQDSIRPATEKVSGARRVNNIRPLGRFRIMGKTANVYPRGCVSVLLGMGTNAQNFLRGTLWESKISLFDNCDAPSLPTL